MSEQINAMIMAESVKAGMGLYCTCPKIGEVNWQAVQVRPLAGSCDRLQVRAATGPTIDDAVAATLLEDWGDAK
jgi:hypothetical protein